MTDRYIDATARRRLDDFLATIDKDYKNYLGFPASLDFDYAELAPYLQRMLNNVGDPLVESWHTLSSKVFEREVLAFFAELFRAEDQQWWGYVTNGSTECNLFALYVARESLRNAVVYYSQAAHYSIPKNVYLLGLEGVVVNCQPNGEMDYDSLGESLQAHKNRPAIVVATVGSTMTEAKDDVALIKERLIATGVPTHYIHVDGALSAAYLPFVAPHHNFDFKDGADSIGVSGHKFIGSPIPCGIVLVRQSYKESLKAAHNYTGSIDATISGSRNGHTVLFLWYALQRWGKQGLAARARQALDTAAYAYQRLQDIGWDTWRNDPSLTVMLAAPPQELIVKWQLATQGSWSHIICMPGVTRTKIDRFIMDLTHSKQSKESRAT